MDEPKVEPGARRDAKSASSRPLWRPLQRLRAGNTELKTPPGGEYTSMKDRKYWCAKPGRGPGLRTETTLKALINLDNHI
jgi:hypothetical protein